MNNKKNIMILLGIVTVATMLSNCNQQEKAPEQSTQAPTPVTTMTAQLELVNINYKSIGTLIPREAPIIRTQIAGQISAILIHEGEPVQKGQILLTLKQEELSLQLKEANAKLSQAKAVLNEREKNVARANKLVGKGYISKEQHDEMIAQYQTAQANIEVANAELEHATYETDQANIKSPINGHIGKINVSVGELVAANAQLMNIVNHDQLVAELPFSEQKTLELKPGQKIILVSPTAPNEALTSTVTSITPDINPENRAIKAIVVFNNQYHWTPGSSVEGKIYGTPLTTIMVPAESVVMQTNNSVVFIVKNNKAVSSPVETGYETDGWIAITKGVNPGDLVVVSGANYLANGSPVVIQKPAQSKL